MKPRARRVTLAATALGVGVVAVLVVVNWGVVRDHVEGWWFVWATKPRRKEFRCNRPVMCISTATGDASSNSRKFLTLGP